MLFKTNVCFPSKERRDEEEEIKITVSDNAVDKSMQQYSIYLQPLKPKFSDVLKVTKTTGDKSLSFNAFIRRSFMVTIIVIRMPECYTINVLMFFSIP